MALIHARAFGPAAHWDAAAIATLLASPGVFGTLDAAGGMGLARSVAEEAEILTIAVAPEARRRGLGAALLAELVQQAARSGATRLFLEVAEGNLPALGLYAAAGFAVVGRRRGYYSDGEDALLMRLDVCGRSAGA